MTITIALVSENAKARHAHIIQLPDLEISQFVMPDLHDFTQTFIIVLEDSIVY
jgi:hypothetical protein